MKIDFAYLISGGLEKFAQSMLPGEPTQLIFVRTKSARIQTADAIERFQLSVSILIELFRLANL